MVLAAPACLLCCPVLFVVCAPSSHSSDPSHNTPPPNPHHRHRRITPSPPQQKAKYGDAFEAVKARTSVLPFAAILDGRQRLPGDYYKEFLRWPYVAVTLFTVGAYFAHPLMQAASYGVKW